MRSQRQLRVGEEIRHALATLFMRGDVPWPRGLTDMPDVTVTEVQVSPDLKNATVFVMPLGGQKLDETVRALNHIVGHFRHEVAQVIALRYTPKMRFAADNSFVYAQKIDDILHQPDVAKDLEKDEGEETGDEGKY
jgi:ribosome-binding factor A